MRFLNEPLWQNPRLARWAGLMVILAAAVLYLSTLDTGLRFEELSGGDLITHQYAQVEARPSNAPGYPLYTMGGWLWFRLGRVLLSWALNPVQVLSLYSTWWGLAALVVLYLILLQVTAGRWPIAALLTAYYAVTYFFWFYSVTTEQYTSAIFQTLLLVWLAFRWEEQPADNLVLWLALLAGTMAANMVTTLFILPPLLWFLLARCPGYVRRFELHVKALLAALLPLLSYTYVFVRGAQHPEWRGAGQWDSAWRWFIDFVSIRQGRDELAPGLTAGDFFTAEFPALIWGELTWIVLVGGLVGIALLGRRRALFLYGVLAIYTVFSWGFRFGNWFQVILPAYPLIIVGFAALMAGLWQRSTGGKRVGFERTDRLVSRFFFFGTPWSRIALILLLLVLVGYRFAVSFPQADQRYRLADDGLDPGWAILADQPKLPAVVLGDYEERLALEYLSTIWGAAPGLRALGPEELFVAASSEGESLHRYVTRRGYATFEVDANGPVWLQAAGWQLIEIALEPRRQLPPGVEPLAVDVGGGLRLVGIEQIANEDVLPSQTAEHLVLPDWQIALYWTPSIETEANLSVSVRPLVEGQLIYVQGEPLLQDQQPVWGVYPTSRWQVGEVIRDVYGLNLPPDRASEVTAVQIVLYRSVTGDFENVGEVTVQLQSAKTR